VGQWTNGKMLIVNPKGKENKTSKGEKIQEDEDIEKTRRTKNRIGLR